MGNERVKVLSVSQCISQIIGHNKAAKTNYFAQKPTDKPPKLFSNNSEVILDFSQIFWVLSAFIEKLLD